MEQRICPPYPWPMIVTEAEVGQPNILNSKSRSPEREIIGLSHHEGQVGKRFCSKLSYLPTSPLLYQIWDGKRPQPLAMRGGDSWIQNLGATDTVGDWRFGFSKMCKASVWTKCERREVSKVLNMQRAVYRIWEAGELGQRLALPSLSQLFFLNSENPAQTKWSWVFLSSEPCSESSPSLPKDPPVKPDWLSSHLLLCWHGLQKKETY